MSKSNKLPAIQFYPGDWKRDVGVQSLSFHDRGIWMEILFLMHESTERGKLTLNGNPVPIDPLARMIGIDVKSLSRSLENIIAAGVPDVEEGTGILMNRRMVRDEQIRQIRSECGKLGGNPNLLNHNASKTTGKNKPKAEIKDGQNETPSISFSTSSSEELLLTGKDFLKDEILNKGHWMIVRSSLSGFYQGDDHLLKLLDQFCEEKQYDEFKDTKHRFNSFRYWVRNLKQNANPSQNQSVVVQTIAVSKPMGD